MGQKEKFRIIVGRSRRGNIDLDITDCWKVQCLIQGGRVVMTTTSTNDQKPTVNSNGYNGSEPTRKCPRCGQTKPLSEFGWRDMGNGEVRNQSYCSRCRAYR